MKLLNATLSMTSLEIADLVDARHDNVKRTVERLVTRMAITLPPLEEIRTSTKPATVYEFVGEQGN